MKYFILFFLKNTKEKKLVKLVLKNKSATAQQSLSTGSMTASGV